MSGTPFTVTQKEIDDTLLLHLSGPLDETAKFPEMRLRNRLRIHMGKVTTINSIGTRTWCLWIQRLRVPGGIELEECPAIFVKSFTIVKGFLPDNCKVLSFYIPFYSDETGERRDFLAVLGRHYFADGRISIPGVKDSEGHLMEMDIIPETYLAFLKP